MLRYRVGHDLIFCGIENTSFRRFPISRKKIGTLLAIDLTKRYDLYLQFDVDVSSQKEQVFKANVRSVLEFFFKNSLFLFKYMDVLAILICVLKYRPEI